MLLLRCQALGAWLPARTLCHVSHRAHRAFVFQHPITWMGWNKNPEAEEAEWTAQRGRNKSLLPTQEIPTFHWQLYLFHLLAFLRRVTVHLQYMFIAPFRWTQLRLKAVAFPTQIHPILSEGHRCKACLCGAFQALVGKQTNL